MHKTGYSKNSMSMFSKSKKYINAHKGDISMLIGFAIMGIGLALIFGPANPNFAMTVAGLFLVVFSSIPISGKACLPDEDSSFTY